MIDGYFRVIESFLTIYGVGAIFLLGIFEEVAFFIPMSLLFVAAGFFIIDHHAKFFPALLIAIFKVGLPGTLGVVFGGLVMYWLVYWGGKPLIRKYGPYVNLNWDDIEMLHRRFKTGHIDEAVLVFLRAVPIFPIGIVSIFCGLVRIGWQEFISTTFVGTLIRLSSLSLLGWYLGREYIKYALKIAAVERYIALIFLVVILVVLVYLYERQRKRRSKD